MTDDDRVFKALADPTRRFLLDRLHERYGRTLTEPESGLEMTRLGVMEAPEGPGGRGPRRRGRAGAREAPPPRCRPDPAAPRPLDRHVQRAPPVGARRPRARTGERVMTTAEEDRDDAGPPRLDQGDARGRWAAIADPELTDRYGYGGFPGYGDMQPGRPYRVIAGSGMQEQRRTGATRRARVVEAARPRPLVLTWRMLMIRRWRTSRSRVCATTSSHGPAA
jgi:hypothetical protein